MPIFEFNASGKTYQLTAPDQQTAINAFQNYHAGIPATGDSSGADTSAPIASPVPGYVPGQPLTPEQRSAFQVNWDKPATGAAPPEWQPPADVMPAPLRAFSTGAIESVPVLGAIAHNMRDPMMRAIDAKAAAQSPLASTAGQVFGSVAPFVVGGEIPGIAKILGMDAGMGLAGQVGAGAASMAALTGADSAIRGDNPGQVALNTGLGLAGGAAGPLIGKGIGAVAGKIGDVAKGLFAPGDAAEQVLTNAARKDINAGHFMDATDEANAALNGQPVINADRLGPNTRVLARTAANLDPTAKQTLNDVVQDRFLTQNDRGVQFVNRMVGGNSDALAAQNSVEAAGRAANKPAYLAAYNHPDAQAIMTPEIGQLMQAPAFQKAIRSATATGANDAAINGFTPVKNPFRFNADGSYTLAKLPDGSTATPNLQFWDQVQRNLRTGAQMSARQGDNVKSAQNWQLRTQLNNVLDSTVPEFQAARQGAAGAFGAEDALEAGQKFVGMPSSQIPAAIAAHAKFSPAEQKLFATGFASNLINKIGQANDHSNVVKNVFESPNARAQIQTALSPVTSTAPQQLEHFLHIENIMHSTKQAVQGGSSTVAQAAAAAALGGYGTGAIEGGWNPLNWNGNTWRNAASVGGLFGAGRIGAQKLGMAVDQKVMQSVAAALSSHDPQAIFQVMKNATRSPQTANSIRAIQRGVQEATGAGTSSALDAQPAQPALPGPGGPQAPLAITVPGATPGAEPPALQ